MDAFDLIQRYQQHYLRGFLGGVGDGLELCAQWPCYPLPSRRSSIHSVSPPGYRSRARTRVNGHKPEYG